MPDFPLEADVQCSDGPCGKSTNLILNAVTRKVAFVVVEDKKPRDNPTRLAPGTWIDHTTPCQIALNGTHDAAAGMDPFVVTRFIQETGSGAAYSSGGAYTSQYVFNDTGYDSVKEEQIPQGDLVVYSGMKVDATEGLPASSIDWCWTPRVERSPIC